MLEKITWSQYWTTIASTTALYYAGVGMVFYRKKALSLFSQPFQFVEKTPSNLVPVNIMGSINASDVQKIEETLKAPSVDNLQEDTTENIRTLDKTTFTGEQITQALTDLGVNTDSGQVVNTLSTIIKQQNKDGTLTPFRESLNWLMSQIALDTCGIALESEEFDSVWNTQ